MSVDDGFLTFTAEEMSEIEAIYGERMPMMRSFSKILGAKMFAGCSVIAHEYGKNYDGYWDNKKSCSTPKSSYSARSTSIAMKMSSSWFYTTGHLATLQWRKLL